MILTKQGSFRQHWWRIAAVSTGLFTLWISGCTRYLPAKPVPEEIAPIVDSPAPPSGEGRLVIDIVEGSASVERVAVVPKVITDATGMQRTYFQQTREPLCVSTPCIVDRNPGNILLRFPVEGGYGGETELVHISQEPTVYRRSLSRYHNVRGGVWTMGLLGATFGGMSLATGAALLPIGLATDSGGMTTAGVITLGAGALLTALGVWGLNADATVYQPGSSIHF